MHKKRALVLGGYLSLLALAACWPKVIDDADIVSVDYKYSFIDWTVIEQWVKEFTLWSDGEFKWLEPIVRWAKQDDEFQWNINWKDVYWSEYDLNKLQKYPKLIMTEVLWVSNPQVWDLITVNSYGEWVILSQETDEEWYLYYVVDFNNPKTYSDFAYTIKIKKIEKK